MQSAADLLLQFSQILFIELALFAAVGFIIGGLDELAVDALWIGRATWRRLTIYRRYSRTYAADLPDPSPAFRLAVLVPAWDEARVIGPMLRQALRAYAKADVTIFVGCYPNDKATIAAARSVQAPSIRVVVGARPGPTTKADCLNGLWSAIAAEYRGERAFDAICLHDAEDVISPFEAGVIAHLLPRFGLIQLPVVPLVKDDGAWVSGHYCDEFAESHGKTMIVREALGAALPLAGVGCALRIDMLERLAVHPSAGPFDAGSLTEDYETGIKLGATGCASAFVRMRESRGGPLVATRAYFPATSDAAVRQKSRWLIGIGISGWDRIGWGGGLVERWMRWRDRQGLLAALVLCVGYAATIPATLLLLSQASGGPRLDIPPFLRLMIWGTSGLLIWRLAVRAFFVGRVYGLGEALRSIPRAVVGNTIAILAAVRALTRYADMSRNGAMEWDKTAHYFPEQRS